MSLQRVKQYFENAGLGQRVHELSQTTATVDEAAKAIGCKPEHIAKTMSFLLDGGPILIVTAGTLKLITKNIKAISTKRLK